MDSELRIVENCQNQNLFSNNTKPLSSILKKRKYQSARIKKFSFEWGNKFIKNLK